MWALGKPTSDATPSLRVVECGEAVGTDPGVIADVSVYEGFAAIRRGPAPAPPGWRLQRAISRGAYAAVSLRQLARQTGKELKRRWR